MSTTRKSILVAGLGRNADPKRHPVDKFEEILKVQLTQLSDIGFDAEHISLNPNEILDSMDRLKKVLDSKPWDAFEVGFAVRGNPEITELFEKAVNMFVTSHPGKKLLFPTTPMEISVAPLRIFPVDIQG